MRRRVRRAGSRPRGTGQTGAGGAPLGPDGYPITGGNINFSGGALTVTFDEPVLPPLFASIVTLPTLTAVTTPVFGSTLATAGARDVQATLGFDTVAPVTSTTVADRVAVRPTMRETDGGDTVTLCTGTELTVMTLAPETEPIAAVIAAVPTPTAFTAPVVRSTVATLEALVLHVTA